MVPILFSGAMDISYRYLAICHALRCHVTGKMARIIIVLIWSFAASVMSPWAVFYQRLEHGDPQLPTTGNASTVTAQTPTPTTTSGSDGVGNSVEYVCVQRWPSARMERNYFLAAIFVTCYTTSSQRSQFAADNVDRLSPQHTRKGNSSKLD